MKFVFIFLLFFSFLQVNAQQAQTVDFKSLKANISFFPESKTVKGKLEYKFHIKKAVDSIFLDGKNMSVELLKKSPLKAKLNATEEKIWIVHNFKAGKNYTVKFSYKTQPKQTLYFIGWETAGSNQIWSQGEGKNTSHWLPSLDDQNDKIIFDMTYEVPKTYTVIANGKLIKHKTTAANELWHFKMNNPMSSYLVAVVVGHYEKKTLLSSNGTPLELYYEPKDSSKVEPTYRYSKKIFDYLENEIGVPYPWQNYKQIPVRDFLYGGMENTTATIFSENSMIDSIGFSDRNYVNINAHELAHQWFGDLVTEHSSKSHWLQEGFATYYALLAERQIFGDDYYYYKLYNNAEKLIAQSDEGKGEALNDPKASSLTFYQKGAWTLHILREKIGDQAFKEGIKSYLKKYKFKNVTNADFITEMEKSSGMDLSVFFDKWLRQATFPTEEALKSLKKSPFIKDYLKIIALRQSPLADKFDQMRVGLDSRVNSYIGQEVVHQLAKEVPSPERLILYKKAFATNKILIRQAIALSLTEIPKALKPEYESLLKDSSYLTRQEALPNLWTNFQEDRNSYLYQLKNCEGFPDKNVRMLWLVLSMATPSYHPEKAEAYYNELSGYTSPAYGYPIRQNAFTLLYQINLFSDQNYKDLLQACTHPAWRFSTFAHELLGKLVEDKQHRQDLLLLEPKLSEKEQKILDKVMGQ